MQPVPTVERLYDEISHIIQQARGKVYQAANFEMVRAYWLIGQKIIEQEQAGKQRAEYGTLLLEALSKKLTKTYGKGFSSRNLRYIRQFYIYFPIWNALRSKLSWTHYRLLLGVEKEEARTYYLEEAAACNWSTRTLERQINSLYYERILASTPKGRLLVQQEAEATKELLHPSQVIKDPYVLEFAGLQTNVAFYEKDLEQGLINRLQSFLLELGKGFSFVGRQYRISLEQEHFYVDLVFYNYILKCFLLIDLKTGKLTHQDIGQMDTYIRYFEDQVKQKDDNPTIGLILCSQKNKALAKYSLLNNSQQIFASKYTTYFPTEAELRQEIEQEREVAEQERKLSAPAHKVVKKEKTS